MKDFINKLISGKNVNPIIVIAAIAAVLLFRNCSGDEISSDQGDVVQVEIDTIFKDGFEKGLNQGIAKADSIMKNIEIPAPEVKIETIIEKEIIEIRDTIEIEKVVIRYDTLYIPRSDSLFVYDSLYIGTNYELAYHIESLGRVRAFAHRMSFPESSIEKIIRTETKIIDDSRNWMLMFEAAGIGAFDDISKTEFYAGGSILRTQKSIGYGVGYLNQIGGNRHAIKGVLSIRF